MLRSGLLRHTVSTTYQSVKLDQNSLVQSHPIIKLLIPYYRNRVKFAPLNIHGIPGFRNVNADITGLSFRSPIVRDCCWWVSFVQWKTEPAGLFITRDRLAANAAFSPRTRSGNTERAYYNFTCYIYNAHMICIHSGRNLYKIFQGCMLAAGSGLNF